MTGIGMAVAAGRATIIPEGFFADWNGTTPYIAGASSGQTNGINSTSGNVVVGAFTNGSGNYSCNFTITNNPSGKLSLTNANSPIARGIGWTGFALNETESITVRIDGTDLNTGFTGSDFVTVSIHLPS